MIDKNSLNLILDKAVKTAQILRVSGKTEVANTIEGFIEEAKSMKFLIGVVGEAKRGKSTLINGLLGRKDDILAPIDKLPATNVLSLFANGFPERAMVYFNDAPDKGQEILFSQIKSYACEDFNPENKKNVSRLEITARCPLLNDDVILLDTPGADNAMSTLHDQVLLDILPRLDVLLFLTDAGEPLVNAEVTLLKQIKNSDKRKILFVMNKIDKLTQEELSQSIRHNRKVLEGIGCAEIPVFTISAKQFLNTGNDAGVQEIFQAIQEIIERDRLKIKTERISAGLQETIDAARNDMELELACIEKTEADIDADIKNLELGQMSLTDNQSKLAEVSFRKNWQEIFTDYSEFLENIKRETISEYEGLIEKSSGLDILAKTVHTDIAKRIEDKVTPYLQKMNSAIEKTITDFVADVQQKRSASFSGGQIKTEKNFVLDSLVIFSAGMPSALGALVLGTAAGGVSSVILATAPGAVAWSLFSPSSWLLAGGAAVGKTAAGATALAAGAVVGTIATFGVPMLLIYSSYKIYKAWDYKTKQTKNELLSGIRKLITDHIDSIKDNVSKIHRQEAAIIEKFHFMHEANIQECKLKLEKMKAGRPDLKHLAKLKEAIALLDKTVGAEKKPLHSSLLEKVN